MCVCVCVARVLVGAYDLRPTLVCTLTSMALTASSAATHAVAPDCTAHTSDVAPSWPQTKSVPPHIQHRHEQPVAHVRQQRMQAGFASRTRLVTYLVARIHVDGVDCKQRRQTIRCIGLRSERKRRITALLVRTCAVSLQPSA